MILHMGVIDVPYRNPLKRKGNMVPRTTGDVAIILEAKYSIMQAFWRVHGERCTEDLLNSMLGALETAHMRGFVEADPYAGAEAKIAERFRDFITSGEAERIGIPGTPTKAAHRGVSHRFKRPYVRRGPRVSFYDTGLYVDSFRCEVEE